MEPKRFEAILNEIGPFAERVCLHVMGEPLAHPDFSSFVEIAGRKNVPLEITTNGTLLHAELENTLLHPTVKQVNFSLQSFADNFPNASPWLYWEKIFRFLHRAMELRPELYLNLRLWNLSAKDQTDEKNRSFLLKLKDEFGEELNPRVDLRLQKRKKIKGRLYLHYDSRFTWPNPKDPILRTSGTCYGARRQIAILADETVVPCCLDKDANISLGSLAKTNFSSILDSARFQAIRQGFAEGKLVESLCQRCQYATRFTRRSWNSCSAGIDPAGP